jgi:Na+/H+ antiporter NhaD/arsenite permease-like protein
MKKVLTFLSNNAVLIIAIIAAIITSFFNAELSFGEIFEFLDIKTLSCLFGMMLVIAACKNIKVFRISASYILKKFGSTRKIVFALVFTTFIFSMFIANDMALLTFLPFTFMVFKELKRPKLIMYTIVLQNIGANLGGMLTPFGNPQNLYLYSYYQIPNLEFFKIMGIPFLISILLIIICCFFVKDEHLEPDVRDYGKIDKKRASVYAVLFILSVLIVFRFIPYFIGLGVIVLSMIILDRKAFMGVDYGLLLTFTAFFIFTGNLSKIPAVTQFLTGLVQKSTLLFGIISCQLISNVPSAVLFSRFTPPSLYPELLLAVNLGGMGTLIASLASLISFRAFSREYKQYSLKYFLCYSLVNFSLLIILTILTILIVGGLGWVNFVFSF